jgi:chromosome segregation ATPase
LTEEQTECDYVIAEWSCATPGAVSGELAFLSRAISAAQQRIAELSRWGANLERDLCERTSWALSLDRQVTELQHELAERTTWTLGLDEQIRALEMELVSERERMTDLEGALEARTKWAWALERECSETTGWAHRLEDQLTAERRLASQMVYLRPAMRRLYEASRATWHQLRAIWPGRKRA